MGCTVHICAPQNGQTHHLLIAVLELLASTSVLRIIPGELTGRRLRPREMKGQKQTHPVAEGSGFLWDPNMRLSRAEPLGGVATRSWKRVIALPAPTSTWCAELTWRRAGVGAAVQAEPLRTLSGSQSPQGAVTMAGCARGLCLTSALKPSKCSLSLSMARSGTDQVDQAERGGRGWGRKVTHFLWLILCSNT